ncbi:MAG: acyl--CoA ligase [Xanthobacteraceae bacterium]|nr:acyl--CoA ligase [Xanthobacteraceae bacterium]
MHPVEMLLYWARISPERPALIQSNMVISYQALAQAVVACSERIRACGFSPGEPVGVAVSDPAKLLVVCLALLRSGVSCAPVAQASVPTLPSSGINCLIHSPGSPVLTEGKNIAFDDSWLQADDLPASSMNGRLPPANVIFFTSGTTGVPKKVVLPTVALVARMGLNNLTGQTRFKKVLVAPGVTSNFGFVRICILLESGKTIVFAADVSYPLRLIETFQIDAIVASPQQALALVEMIEASPGHRLDSVKEISIGGGALSPDLARRVQALLCRSIVTEYGATEAGLVALAPYETVRNVPGAVGIVVPGMHIEIVDDNNQPVPIGEEGYIRGRSQFITAIYQANNDNGAADGTEAWWFPGDIGRLTEHGFLCISGRTDDIINCGGVKVSAVVLDELIKSFPGVRDGGVCSVRGDADIDVVWIGVTSDTDIDLVALRQFVEQRQNFQLRIGSVVRIEKVPRGDLGKIRRHELKALLVGARSRNHAEASSMPADRS